MKSITFESSSKEIIDSALELNDEEISAELLMLKCEQPALALLSTALISFASGVGINLFSQWLYEKIKDKPSEKIIINGNQINANTATVIQITKIIQNQPNSTKAQNKPNG